MVWIYLGSLIFGGVFVGLSVVSGLGGDGDLEVDKDVDFDKEIEFEFDKEVEFEFDNDFDHDVDMDADLDADHEIDIDLAGGDVDSDKDIEVHHHKKYIPFVSFKFYTFLCAFFGLTGVLLTLAWDAPMAVFITSSIMGLMAGLVVTYALHVAGKAVGGKMATERDYRGTSAQVVLPVSVGKPGKVKFRLKGRLVEMSAVPFDKNESEFVLDLGEECLVIEVDNGVAKVMQTSALTRKE